LVMKAAKENKFQEMEQEVSVEEGNEEQEVPMPPNTSEARRSIFDRFTEKLKEFLDNAE